MVGKIKGTGSYRPVQVWDNDKLSHMMDTSDEWIRGRTGIGQRHIASGGETVAYMAARAAEEALSDAGMRPEEIDLLLVSTMSSERIMPCAACEVQKLIGAVNAACFDLNGACTGFLLALNTAQAYLGQQIYRRALVIGSETLSHLTNWKDRSTCVLFGDGAGAVVLEAEENASDEELLKALKEEKFYATQGPEIHIRRENNEVTVICSPVSRISFFSNAVWAPERCHRGDGLTKAVCHVQPWENFIRAEVTDAQGKMAWSRVIRLNE